MSTRHGFELLRAQDVPEINTRAEIFRHIKTGALLLSLQNDDENKTFGIAFRTPPANSTGIAHILEHGVLAGSRKYPLKDPFAELLKGSLKTFLNAVTYPDRTVYPVASTNLKDFYHLVDVYLDTVFHPLLRRETFEQQGWHYELERHEDPLIYKGVVFNEMKGAYSSPDGLLGRVARQVLFPDTTYGVDSGGDPQQIPDLTYEDWRAFHRRYYHPSNAMAFFYGDDDPDERLRLLDAYFRDFEPAAIDGSVALQPRWEEPRRLSFPYAVAAANGPAKALAKVTWALGEVADQETVLGLSILDHILVGTPAAPLRRALIESGLGEQMTGSGLMLGLRELIFSAGLKGVAREKIGAVEDLVLTTLESLAAGAIDTATIAASLNTVEFALRENNTASTPRGIALLYRVLTTWTYGADPLAPLAFAAPLNAIKARVAAGEPYFEQLITRYLLDNPHRASVALEPDPELQARAEADERSRLEAARTTMSAEDLQALIDRTHALKAWQETPDPPEVVATIPSLELSDLPREITRIPIEVEERQGVRLLTHDLFSNGIAYFDLGMNLHSLPQELLFYLPLFARALTNLGTRRESFIELQQRIGRSTGGVGAGTMVVPSRFSPRGAAWLFLRGKATVENSGDLLAIMRDVLLEVQLDNRERFRQLVLEAKAGAESALVPSGHGFVASRLRSFFSEPDWADEQLGGVSYLFFLRQLAEQVDSDWPTVLARLDQIRATLLNREGMIVNLTLDAAGQRQVMPALDGLLAELPSTPFNEVSWAAQLGAVNEGLTIPAQVNYVGKGTNLYRLGFGRHGSTSVIARYLRATWLWERVRVQGGAYSGGCQFDQRSGMFVFTSYRDPNLLGTLDVYDQSGAFLRSAALGPADLSRAVIGTISDIDAYQLPDAKGRTSLWQYLLGETEELRQQYRDEVLGTSAADFRAFADVLDAVREQGTVVVMGSAARIEEVNATLPGLLRITQVL